MTLDNIKKEITYLQNNLYSTVIINDAIIELDFENTGNVESCPPHTHTWFEFNYIIAGDLHTSFGEEMLSFKSGDFFIVPPGMEHFHKYNNKNPHEGVFIRWQVKKNKSCTPDSQFSLFNYLNNLRTWEPKIYKDEYSFYSLIIQLFEELKRTNSAINLQLLFVKFLCSVAEIHDKSNTTYQSEYLFSYRTLLKKIEILLNDVNIEKITVHSIAASLHMSYGHLARIYKKLTGITLVEKLSSVKLEKSIELLKNPSLSISEISNKTGFSSQYYFSRVFKDRYGICPKEYRKRNNC